MQEQDEGPIRDNMIGNITSCDSIQPQKSVATTVRERLAEYLSSRGVKTQPPASVPELKKLAEPDREDFHVCVANKCTNSKKKGWRMFRFPRDEERCKKWVLNSGRDDLKNKSIFYLNRSCYLCSAHFENNQFLNTTSKKKLSLHAVPTLFNFPKLPPQLVTVLRLTSEIKKESPVQAPEQAAEIMAMEEETDRVIDKSEEQEPVALTEVKIEVDIAEEPPQSCHVKEEHPPAPVKEEPNPENIASIQMEHASEMQAVPTDFIDVHVKQEIPEDHDSIDSNPGKVWSKRACLQLSVEKDISRGRAASVQLRQSSETQAVSSSQSEIVLKQEVAEDAITDSNEEIYCTSSIEQGQAVDTQTVPSDQNISIEQEQDKGQFKQEIDEDNMTRNVLTDPNLEVIWTESCQHCDAKFSVQSQLKRHMLTHRVQKSIACQDCDATFSSSSHLKRHLSVHSVRKPLACEECNASFSSSSQFRCHMLTHTVQKSHACQRCDAAFTDSNTLKKHLLTHAGQKPHACQHCDARFTKIYNLNQHVLIHTGERPHVCNLCDARFTQSSHLKKHILVHTGQKPHTCQQCDAKFISSGSLKQHMLIHSGEKPHACDHCGAKFRSLSNMKQHTLIHTDAKFHACEQCGAKFRWLSNMKQHIVLVHTGQKPHVCQHCNARFAVSSFLKKHMLIHTGQKPHVCQQCGAKFAQSGNLKRHLSTHTGPSLHNCQQCDAKFNHFKYLKKHMLMHTPQGNSTDAKFTKTT